MGYESGDDFADVVAKGGSARRAADNASVWKDEPKKDGEVADLIVSSKDFIAGFEPPDYLIEGLLNRRYFYSMTARTGDGKTAVALTMTAHVALGHSLGGRDVAEGKVLYFAGENPTDVKMRWIAMAERMGFDANTIEVYFVEGAFHLKEVADRVRQESERLGITFSLIVVDTSAAYFDGDAENDNTQHGDYARRLRKLTTMPGGPTVVVLCHPVKNAASDNLLPRGGGAYIAEVDGNLTCLLRDKVLEISWQGKYRGLHFEPWHFELVEVTAEKLKDQKGERIVTVMARALSDRDHSKKIAETRSEEETLLVAMFENEDASVAELGRKCGWLISRGKDIGKPQKSKVSNKLGELQKAGMVKNTLHTWELTVRGKTRAGKIRDKQTRSEA